MSFLTNKPVFDGTVFKERDLKIAKNYLLSAIKRINPSWLDNPIGNLALHWKTDGQYAACYLIWVAQTLYKLDKNITQKSVPIFQSKFLELLKATNSTKFEETMTELEVAAAIVEKISPISFEPLVKESDFNSSEKPKSPDFAVRLPDGDILIEVTVLHFDMLNKWQISCNFVINEINKWLIKSQISRNINLRIPLDFKHNKISNKDLLSLITQLKLEKEGEIRYEISGYSIDVKWDSNTNMNSGIANMVYVQYQLALTDDVNESYLKSVRNTLDRKRKQLDSNADIPYVIAIKLGDEKLTYDGFNMLINNRIWTNSEYSGISGILLYKGNYHFQTNQPLCELNLNMNPNAKVPVTQCFIDVFEGKSQYHLNRQ
jgi:hypothetical protein